MHRIVKALWLTLAAILVFYSWVWDKFIALGHWLIDRLPWQPFKDAVARLIARLPAPVVLLLFIVPVLVILPFKLAGLWLIGHGRILSGAAVFIAAKFAGVGAAAFIFDIARDKLLSMAWFSQLYRWIVAWRDWAHALLAPFKQRVRNFIAPLRARLAARFGGSASRRFSRRIALLRRRLSRP